MEIHQTNFRRYSFFDKTLSLLTNVVNKTKVTQTTTAHPGSDIAESSLTVQQRQCSSSLMRVNHSGEVCAQALYCGQLLLTNDLVLKKHFAHAMQEEEQHLNWCATRLKELRAKPSLLNPVWSLGAFSIGMVAGLAGDKWSLGFLAETEYQVTRHLDKHLQKLPAADMRSRAILQQMRVDELQHATGAIEHGGRQLPLVIKKLMTVAAKIMVVTASYI